MGGGAGSCRFQQHRGQLTGGLISQLGQHGLAGGQLSAQGGHEGKHGQAAVDQLCGGSGEGGRRGQGRGRLMGAGRRAARDHMRQTTAQLCPASQPARTPGRAAAWMLTRGGAGEGHDLVQREAGRVAGNAGASGAAGGGSGGGDAAVGHGRLPLRAAGWRGRQEVHFGVVKAGEEW